MTHSNLQREKTGGLWPIENLLRLESLTFLATDSRFLTSLCLQGHILFPTIVSLTRIEKIGSRGHIHNRERYDCTSYWKTGFTALELRQKEREDSHVTALQLSPARLSSKEGLCLQVFFCLRTPLLGNMCASFVVIFFHSEKTHCSMV